MKRLVLIGGVVLTLGACTNNRPPEPYYQNYGYSQNYGYTPLDPTIDMHLDTKTRQVHPSVGANLGPLRVSASGNGGRVGTRLGMFGISAGF